MARRQITVNEIVEMVFQWHQGASLKQICRSLGFQRNTARKYVRLAQRAGVIRGKPLPERSELAAKLKSAQDKGMVRDTPKRALIALHREWISSVIQEPHMTAKQICG